LTTVSHAMSVRPQVSVTVAVQKPVPLAVAASTTKIDASRGRALRALHNCVGQYAPNYRLKGAYYQYHPECSEAVAHCP
jgi:hypothetical protein